MEIYTTNFDGASDLDVPLGMPVRVTSGKGRQSELACGIAGYVGPWAPALVEAMRLSPIEGPMAAGCG